MKELLKIELERAFKNKLFYFSIAVGLIITGFQIYNKILPYSELGKFGIEVDGVDPPVGVYMMWFGLVADQYRILYFFIIPILAALPYTTTIYLDVKKNYVNQIAVRISKKKYFMAKLVTQFAVGGSVTVIPLAVSFLITALLLPAIHPEPGTGIYALGDPSILGNLFYSVPLVSVILYLVIAFLAGGLINSIAFSVANWIDNRFVIILVPFILCFFEMVISGSFGIKSIFDFITIDGLEFQSFRYNFPIFLIIGVLSIVACILRGKRKDLL